MAEDTEWRVDPDLTRPERETYIRFGADEPRATVHTDNPHIFRRLLALPHFEETTRYRSGSVIHGGEGTVPVGALKVRASVRTAGGNAEVVSGGADDE